MRTPGIGRYLLLFLGGGPEAGSSRAQTAAEKAGICTISARFEIIDSGPKVKVDGAGLVKIWTDQQRVSHVPRQRGRVCFTPRLKVKQWQVFR